MNKNCGNCKDSKQGKLYYDKNSDLFCIELLEKYDKPQNKNVLVPFVCTTCGTVNFKCINQKEN